MFAFLKALGTAAIRSCRRQGADGRFVGVLSRRWSSPRWAVAGLSGRVPSRSLGTGTANPSRPKTPNGLEGIMRTKIQRLALLAVRWAACWRWG